MLIFNDGMGKKRTSGEWLNPDRSLQHGDSFTSNPDLRNHSITMGNLDGKNPFSPQTIALFKGHLHL
jgi:hypothetical protein